MTHIIFDPTQPVNVTVVYDYTQWDEAGNVISPAPVYPNPYAQVVINAAKLSDVDKIFKERFPRAVVWNGRILPQPQAKRA